MRVFVVLSAIACALALPSLAAGGGWATVGFEPLPDDTAAGSAWKPTIFVKQHGVTPLAGLQPVVTIEETGTGETREFLAEPGSEIGVYEAEVVFPSAGDWRVTIFSGFGDSQVSYGPAAIGTGGAGGDSRQLPFVGLGIALIALLGGVALLASRRSRRLTPASG